MKEITVKNIPERIYKELEKKAIRNNHTLDEEILIQLNNIFAYNSQKINLNSGEWQKISRTNRDNMKFMATEKEISDFKNIGKQ